MHFDIETSLSIPITDTHQLTNLPHRKTRFRVAHKTTESRILLQSCSSYEQFQIKRTTNTNINGHITTEIIPSYIKRILY